MSDGYCIFYALTVLEKAPLALVNDICTAAVGTRRSNVSRQTPKSAIIQHAVHPPEKNTKRQSASATPQRLAVQPPVSY